MGSAEIQSSWRFQFRCSVHDAPMLLKVSAWWTSPALGMSVQFAPQQATKLQGMQYLSRASSAKGLGDKIHESALRVNASSLHIIQRGKEWPVR
jgi:hypothetical protein